MQNTTLKLMVKSVPELIKNYLESLAQKNRNEISPKLKKIVGAVKLPKKFNEDKTLRSHFEKKH